MPFALGVMALSIEPAMHSLTINEQSPDPNGLPRYWIKALIPLAFFLLSLQGISEGIQHWAKLKASTNQDVSSKEQSFD